MKMSDLKGCVAHSPTGCPVTVFDLIINRCERDYRHVHLIWRKKRNLPASGAIIDRPIVVPLEGAGYGRSFTPVL